MVWTPETTITMKGDVLNPTINQVNNTNETLKNNQLASQRLNQVSDLGLKEEVGRNQ